MTDYAFTGKKGTGKSKNIVRLARDRYFKKGRRVATNLDIYLEPMFGPHSKQTYVRVPDKPSAFDLLAAGHGNPETYDEDNQGMLALDELATWLNSRTFGDKERAATLDFFAHGRKHGWDIFYIMQNVVQIDKQVRESYVEQTFRHIRFDKVKWPFFGGILGALFGEKAAYMPKFHVSTGRMGTNAQELVVDRMTFQGKDIEPCYDTRQVFLMDYPHGTHSVLSPWHVTGRFMEKPKPKGLAGLVLAWKARKAPKVPPKPITAPEPAFGRVLALCRQLPPDQRMRWLQRYIQATV